MAQDLLWNDTENIALRLFEEHPEVDPLTVRFTDLHCGLSRGLNLRMIQRARMKRNWKRSKWPGMKNIKMLNKGPVGDSHRLGL